MQLPTDVEDTLYATLEARADTSCLMAYPETMTLSARLLGRAQITLELGPGTTALPADTALSEPIDLAVVIDAPAALDVSATRHLLARLRNVDAGAVLAVFARDSTGSGWQRRDFLALGFRQLAGAQHLDSAYWLYRYDIHDYKLTPDWLGPRYWANPGNWDKDRW